MRIAFLGKGGAGKTTTAAGFIRFASQRFPFVLAVDADVNAHLRGALHLEGSSDDVHQLGELCDEIFTYLQGDRTDLGERPLIGTTPPALASKFLRPTPEDPFLQRYAQFSDNIGLLTVGTYSESDVGGSCYHTKLRGLAALFHHLLDTEDEIVVADTTAGTDNVATSLSFAYDLNIFVVEPTEKSVRVYSDFLQIAPHLSDRVFVLANKVDGAEDAAFIARNIPSDRLLGTIPVSRYLKLFEQGHRDALAQFHEEQSQAFDNVITTLKSHRRDWNAYLKILQSTHAKVCRDWYNSFYGCKLDEGLDPAFTYKRALEERRNQDRILVHA